MSLTRSQQATFRPLVDRAWFAQCASTGRDSADLVARETWYRSQLRACCEIYSTRDSLPGHYSRLIRWFSRLSSTERVAIRGFTPPQNRVFDRLVASAWEAVTSRGEGRPFGAWLDAELAACDVHDRTAPDHVAAFDEIALHFATLAGDDYWISRLSAAAERRLRYQIAVALDRLTPLVGRPLDWSYVQSIWSRAHAASSIEDATAPILRQVLQMLETHRRRLEKRDACPACTCDFVPDAVPF